MQTAEFYKGSVFENKGTSPAALAKSQNLIIFGLFYRTVTAATSTKWHQSCREMLLTRIMVYWCLPHGANVNLLHTLITIFF